MTTDYDPIAEQYQRSKLQSWRACIESYTLMALLGDLSGQTVVDVACGDGYYTRRIRAAGARRVYGVDLSPAMIALGRAQESQHGLGIEYMVGDGRDLQIGAEPDVVAAAYFLNYARDGAELGAMCGSIGRCLRPGGRFVAVNQNPGLDFRTAPSYRKYGFETTVGDGPWGEGSPSPGPSIWTTAPSPSRTIISILQFTRRRCARGGSGTFAGTPRGCLRRANRGTGASSGECFSSTRPSPSSNA